MSEEAVESEVKAPESPENEMWAFMESALKDIGPRASCSKGELALARRLEKEWSLADLVRFENFKCHPKAFLGLIMYMPWAYALALVLYFWQPWLAFLVMGGTLTVFWLQFVRYGELPFIENRYAEGESQNVSAVLRPKGQVRRRVLVCAHTDSAYECTLWWKFKKWSVPIMAIAAFSLVWLLGVSFARGIAWFFDGHYHMFFVRAGQIALLGYIFVAPFMFFHVSQPVPGAMDNLAGIAVLGGLLKRFKQEREGESGLEQTELQLVAMGCEEAGLRGSRRYVAAHVDELYEDDVETYAISLDGVCDDRELCVVSKEMQLMVSHDESLVHLAKKVAARQKRSIKTSKLLLGATDTCSFSQQSVRAVAIFATPAGELVPNYHTRDDDLEHMRPEALTAVCDLVHDMIYDLDLQTRPRLPEN